MWQPATAPYSHRGSVVRRRRLHQSSRLDIGVCWRRGLVEHRPRLRLLADIGHYSHRGLEAQVHRRRRLLSVADTGHCLRPGSAALVRSHSCRHRPEMASLAVESCVFGPKIYNGHHLRLSTMPRLEDSNVGAMKSFG